MTDMATTSKARENVTIRFNREELAALDDVVHKYDAQGFDLGRAGVLRLLVKREAASMAPASKARTTKGPASKARTKKPAKRRR
jgi:DUF2075 family protein